MLAMAALALGRGRAGAHTLFLARAGSVSVGSSAKQEALEQEPGEGWGLR